MSDTIHCPKCGSTQISSNKKGFSGKKAVAGALLTGGVGVLAGTIGSNDIEITCLACGNTWEPKEYASIKQHQHNLEAATELDKWKEEFITAYNFKDFDKAKSVYESNKAMYERYPDFHEGYKQITSGDTTLSIIGVLLIVGFIALMFWLFI